MATAAPSLSAEYNSELNSYAIAAGGTINPDGSIAGTLDFSKASPEVQASLQKNLEKITRTVSERIEQIQTTIANLRAARDRAQEENRNIQLLVGSQLNSNPTAMQKFTDNANLVDALNTRGLVLTETEKAITAFKIGKLKLISDAAETIPAPRNYRHLVIQTAAGAALLATGYAIKAFIG